jgi:hypothetical protein
MRCGTCREAPERQPLALFCWLKCGRLPAKPEADSERQPLMKNERHRRADGELLTDQQLARKLGATCRQIRSWRVRRIIPSIRLGYRTIRFRLESVIAALEKRSIKPLNLGARER